MTPKMLLTFYNTNGKGLVQLTLLMDNTPPPKSGEGGREATKYIPTGSVFFVLPCRSF